MTNCHHSVDLGTAEMHREAYNAAFEDLGLSWHWDCATFSALPATDGVRSYIEREQSHLLLAYDVGFLVEAIEAAKRRRYQVMQTNRARTLSAPTAARELAMA
jgi:hypothetical protein